MIEGQDIDMCVPLRNSVTFGDLQQKALPLWAVSSIVREPWHLLDFSPSG